MTVPIAEIIRLRRMSEDSIILHNHTSQERGARMHAAHSLSRAVAAWWFARGPVGLNIPTPPSEESGV
jgi:hypothetical protein